MNYLVLDTSFLYINIYIVKHDEVIKDCKLKVEKDMSNKILPLLRKLLSEVNMSISDINKIFITIGPGSFTGVRIGLTVAKVVSWGLDIPLIPISTLEYLASGMNLSKNKIRPIIDARRGNVFTALYNNNLDVIEKEQLVSFETLENSEDIDLVSYDGFNNSIVSNVDVVKLIEKHVFDVPVNPHTLVPNYIKKTEAEEKFNDSKN